MHLTNTEKRTANRDLKHLVEIGFLAIKGSTTGKGQ